MANFQITLNRILGVKSLNLGVQKKFGRNHNLMIPLLDTGILCAKALRIKKIHVPQISRLVSLDKILLDRGFKKIRTYEIMRCVKEEISKPEVPIGFRSVTLKDIYNIEKNPLVSTYEGYNLCAHKGMEFKQGEIDCELNFGESFITENGMDVLSKLIFNIGIFELLATSLTHNSLNFKCHLIYLSDESFLFIST